MSVTLQESKLEPVTVGTRHGSLVLECRVAGSPSPTIHWLKDGERIQQVSNYFAFSLLIVFLFSHNYSW